jgi:hypothetical protein
MNLLRGRLADRFVLSGIPRRRVLACPLDDPLDSA